MTERRPPIEELDAPKPLTRSDGILAVSPADFGRMTPAEALGWPRREYRRWLRRRLCYIVTPIAIAVVVGLLSVRLGLVLGCLGLILDIVGVCLLTEGVLTTPEEAACLDTVDAMGFRSHLAMRDNLQARTGLAVVTAGFLLQFVALVLATAGL